MSGSRRGSADAIPPAAPIANVAIFAALQWECRPILRQLRQVRREKLGSLDVWRAETGAARFTVVKTGIGLERAEAAAHAAAESGRFDLFLSSGCAGALASHLVPGDLIIAESLRLAALEPVGVHPQHRDAALAAAERAGVRSFRGSVLSSARMLGGAEEKQAAAGDGSIAVEMEGAAIARIAAAAGIPFASVRSILDRADTTIEPGGTFVDPATGSVRPGALALHLLRNPPAISRLLAVKKMMDASEASLARFFREYLHSASCFHLDELA